MLAWSVTIPMFWVLTLRNLAEGVFGEKPRALGRALASWVVPITVASYVVVALIAQFRLDVIAHL